MASKLDEAASAGLEGVEIFYEDLEYYAKSLPGGATGKTLKQAAHEIRSMCDSRGLEIICLQPFMHSEGLRDRQRRAAKLEELKSWFALAQILRVDLIQMPASFLPEHEITGDMDVIVQDFREVAELGAAYSPPFRFAFESLCFSTYINTWEQSWAVVQRVNMPNFGCCLDTYNIGGRVYGDPASADGKMPNAEAELTASMQRLVATVDVRKVFFVQVVDAEKLGKPLVPGHEFYAPDQCSRMSWSRNCRLFYGEQDRGGYLPIKAITRAIIDGLGFRGWVSMELFNRSMNDGDASVPRAHARRAMVSWFKILDDMESCCPEQSGSEDVLVSEKLAFKIGGESREVCML